MEFNKGIIILNAEMPNGCLTCNYNDTCKCTITGSITGSQQLSPHDLMNKRLSDCPLRPVRFDAVINPEEIVDESEEEISENEYDESKGTFIKGFDISRSHCFKCAFACTTVNSNSDEWFCRLTGRKLDLSNLHEAKPEDCPIFSTKDLSESANINSKGEWASRGGWASTTKSKSYNVGDKAITTQRHSCMGGYFEVGTEVTVVEIDNQRGYSITDGEGHTIYEIGWII